MPEIPGIPPQLNENLKRVLSRCGEFQSDRTLSPVFIDNRISIWQNDLPSANSVSQRVQAVIDYLWPLSNSLNENALILFLQVLRDPIPHEDGRYKELDVLARELKTIWTVNDDIQVDPNEAFPVFDLTTRNHLVEALLSCSSMRDRHVRDVIVGDLESVIGNRIPRSERNDVDVINIVNECMNQTNGFPQLITIMHFYEGNSIHFEELENLIAKINQKKLLPHPDKGINQKGNATESTRIPSNATGQFPSQVTTTVPGVPSKLEDLNEPLSFLKLQLICQGPEIEVRGLQVPGGGQPKNKVTTPFTDLELKAILKALDVGSFDPSRFKPEYVDALNKLELLPDNRLHPDFHKIVGKKLYDVLFRGPMQVELKLAQKNSPVACQLCFDPEDTFLSQFPWELLYDDGTHMVVVDKGLELTRYIQFDTPPTPLQTDLPLKMLFIMPPMEDMNSASRKSEFEAIIRELEPLREKGELDWELLAPPTWDHLEETIHSGMYHIIHFDGHGSFARQCPGCEKLYYPGMDSCKECGIDIRKVTPQGYLYFQGDNSQVDPVSVESLSVILKNSSVRLMVLSSCGSAKAGGTSIFNGIAPGLIQIGIPAVIGMQGSPPVNVMAKFFGRVYKMLAQGQRLPAAVNSGRRAVVRAKPLSWFMPAVYLRSSDNSYGKLFNLTLKGNSNG